MEDWVISIKNWGNGYCELQAKANDKLPVYGKSVDELFRKVREVVNQ